MNILLLAALSLLPAAPASAVPVTLTPDNFALFEGFVPQAEPAALVLEGAAKPQQAPTQQTPKAPPPLRKIGKKEFDAEVRTSKGLFIVDFYADWCPTCVKVAGPVLEYLAQQNPSIKFAKVDIDASPELAKEFGIKSIPFILGYKDGKFQEFVLVLEVDKQTKSITSAKLVPKP